MKPRHHSESNQAFSLAEVLTVLAILSMLAAMVAPSLINLIPSRKAQISEIFTFLEMARARAMATKKDVFVCFADSTFPESEWRYRTLGMFSAPSMADESQPVDTRDLKQEEKWLQTTPDVMLGIESDYKYRNSARTRTVLDSGEKREFRFSFNGKSYTATLPYLVFNKAGRLEVPSFNDSEIFVGIVDGFLDGGIRKIKGNPSARRVVGELIVINSLDGKISHLRD